MDWSKYERGHLSDERSERFFDYFTKVFEMYKCDTKDKTAIEIGAGYGKFTEVFVKFFKTYNAVDPDDTLFERLINIKHKHPEANLIKTDCERLLLNDTKSKKQLSFVIFTNSFQFTDKKICMNVVDNILKKDGHLLITLPFPLFSGKEQWQKNMVNEVLWLTQLSGYRTLFLDRSFGMYIVLLQKESSKE